MKKLFLYFVTMVTFLSVGAYAQPSPKKVKAKKATAKTVKGEASKAEALHVKTVRKEQLGTAPEKINTSDSSRIK